MVGKSNQNLDTVQVDICMNNGSQTGETNFIDILQIELEEFKSNLKLSMRNQLSSIHLS